MDKKIKRKKERKGKERKGKEGCERERERSGLRTADLVLFGLNKSELHTH